MLYPLYATRLTIYGVSPAEFLEIRNICIQHFDTDLDDVDDRDEDGSITFIGFFSTVNENVEYSFRRLCEDLKDLRLTLKAKRIDADGDKDEENPETVELSHTPQRLTIVSPV